MKNDSKSKEKSGFVLYKSYFSPIEKFPNEKLGRLFRALYEYQIHGNVNVDQDIQIAFDFFVQTFIEDNKRYAERCRKAKLNAKERWEKYRGMQRHTNDADMDMDMDMDMEMEMDMEIDKALIKKGTREKNENNEYIE